MSIFGLHVCMDEVNLAVAFFTGVDLRLMWASSLQLLMRFGVLERA